VKPLAIDMYAGLGGWAEGLMSAGYRVVGFDIERHEYGDHKYPAQLVLQDVLTLHGSQFKDAALIVASPPCQAYSYRAMPWKRAKALPPPDNSLFQACFRIQREAIEAAGHHIPLVVENVCGAQKWVGRARWHYGSFYLWGDVPALMPIVRHGYKSQGLNWSDRTKRGQDFTRVAGAQAIKNTGGSWFNVAHNTTSGKGQNPDGRKIPASCSERRWEDREVKRLRDAAGVKNGGDWFDAKSPSMQRRGSHGSTKRKAASALIAKIPFDLAYHIGKAWWPDEAAA
jgi:hypothetical protein